MKKREKRENNEAEIKNLPLFEGSFLQQNSYRCHDSGQNVICLAARTQEKHSAADTSNKNHILRSLLDHADKIDW